MWVGDKIYFLSDRDENKRMNLYVIDLTSKQTSKLTDFTDFDIKFPSLGNKAIVYENGGYIYKMDLASGKSEKVKITIADDFLSGRPEWKDVSRSITNFEISPDGKRGLFGAHGEVFTVPEKYGETRNLTQTSGIHERDSKWSDDGKWISYVSDKTGEDEIFIQAQDGSQPALQITSGSANYKYQPLWSPDSKKLMWSDRNQILHFTDVDTKVITDVDIDSIFEIREYKWSPDSKWIAYTKNSDNRFQQVYIYSLEQKKSFPVTDNWYNSSEGTFSSDGKYLFFVSSRDFNPSFSNVGPTISYADMNGIYFVSLYKDTPSLFKLKSDETEPAKIEEQKTEPADKKKESKPAVVKAPERSIDVDGIQGRIGKLPVKSSNYFSLNSVENKLYYQRRGQSDDKSVLLLYDFDAREEKNLGSVDGYEISANKKKMLVNQGAAYAIINLPVAEVKITDKLDLSGMQMKINKKDEWEQIYKESWRQMRDFFYSPNMNGVDWKAQGDKYEQLVKYVNHRNDLTYIVGELIGELGAT